MFALKVTLMVFGPLVAVGLLGCIACQIRIWILKQGEK